MKLAYLFLCSLFLSFQPKVFSQELKINHLLDIRRDKEFQQFVKDNKIKQIVDTTNYLSDATQVRQTLYQLTSFYDFDSFGRLMEREEWYNASDVAYLNKELHYDTLTQVRKIKFNNYHQSLKIDSYLIGATYYINENGRLICDVKRLDNRRFKCSYLVSSSSFNANGEFIRYKSSCNDRGEGDDVFFECNDIDISYEKNQLIVTENYTWHQFHQPREIFKDTLTIRDICAFQSINKNNSEGFSFIDLSDSVVVEWRFEPREKIYWTPNATIALSTSNFVDAQDLDSHVHKVLHFDLVNTENKTIFSELTNVDIEKQDFFRMHQQYADSVNQFYFPEKFMNYFFTVFERDTVKNKIYITEYNYKYDSKIKKILKIFGGMEVRDFSNHLLKYYRGKVDDEYWYIKDLDGYILDEYTYKGDELVAYTLKYSKEPKYRNIEDPLKLKYVTVLKKTKENNEIRPLEPRFKIVNKELGILIIDGRLYQFKTY